MQKVTKAIIFLTLNYIFLLVYAYGVFFQIPVVKGQILTLQAVVEPFAYLVLMTLGNLFVFKAVYSQEKSKKQFFDEKKLLPWAVALLMMVAFGFGIHSSAQLIEETFVNSSTATIHFTDNFSSQLSYFLEEYPGHYLIAMPATILAFFLAKIELNRKKPKSKRNEKGIIAICAVFAGVISAISNAESHSTLFMLPLSFYLLIQLLRKNRQKGRNLLIMPFSSYFTISTLSMILVNIILGFTLGWFVQPTELGFGSI